MPSRAADSRKKVRRVSPLAETLEGRALLATYLAGGAPAEVAGMAGPVQVATAINSGTLDPTGVEVAINWGDGTAPSFGYLGASSISGTAGSTTAVIGTHGYGAAGSYTVTVNLIIPGISGATSTSLYVTGTATVTANAAGGAGVPIFGPRNYPLTNLPLSRFLAPLASTTATNTTPAPTVVIDWGDGSALGTGQIVASPYPGNTVAVVVTGTHTYARAGIYVATINLETSVGGTAGIVSTVITIG